MAAIPEDRRILVTNHEVFGYFADRYGFEVVGAVIPSGSTAEGASAGELAELAELIEAEGVPAIFADTSSTSDVAETLADEVGGIEVIALFSESVGRVRVGGCHLSRDGAHQRHQDQRRTVLRRTPLRTRRPGCRAGQGGDCGWETSPSDLLGEIAQPSVGVIVLVVGIVEDQGVTDPNEPTAEGLPQMRFGEHLLGRPEGDAPGGEEQDQVAALGLGKAVGGDDRGLPGRLEAGQGFDDERSRHDVQAGQGLVEQEDVGLLGQALGHEGPLALPARELMDLAMDQIVEAEDGHGGVDGRPVGGLEPSEQPKLGESSHRHRVGAR